jgi:hypothetical protein
LGYVFPGEFGGLTSQVSAVHLAYCILGGYVCVFSLVSLLIKEKLYIGEASKSLTTPRC